MKNGPRIEFNFFIFYNILVFSTICFVFINIPGSRAWRPEKQSRTASKSLIF